MYFDNFCSFFECHSILAEKQRTKQTDNSSLSLSPSLDTQDTFHSGIIVEWNKFWQEIPVCSGWSPVKKLFWICSFWKVKYFFLAPIGWKLYNYAFFLIAIKDWDVAVWAIRYFLWDPSLMKRKGRCRLPMNLSQTDSYIFKGSM